MDIQRSACLSFPTLKTISISVVILRHHNASSTDSPSRALAPNSLEYKVLPEAHPRNCSGSLLSHLLVSRPPHHVEFSNQKSKPKATRRVPHSTASKKKVGMSLAMPVPNFRTPHRGPVTDRTPKTQCTSRLSGIGIQFDSSLKCQTPGCAYCPNWKVHPR
jgi:hypothetical protein